MRTEKARDARQKLLQLVVLFQRIECPGQASDVDIRGKPESDVLRVPRKSAGESLALPVFYDRDFIPAVQADELASVQL